MSHEHEFKDTGRSEWRCLEQAPRPVEKCDCGEERLGEFISWRPSGSGSFDHDGNLLRREAHRQ